MWRSVPRLFWGEELLLISRLRLNALPVSDTAYESSQRRYFDLKEEGSTREITHYDVLGVRKEASTNLLSSVCYLHDTIVCIYALPFWVRDAFEHCNRTESK